MIKLILLALALTVSTASAQESPPMPNDVKISSDRLIKASTATQQIVGANQLLSSKPARIAIVYDVPNQRMPQIVVNPADSEWKEITALATKIVEKRKADAEKQLKDLSISLDDPAPKAHANPSDKESSANPNDKGSSSEVEKKAN
jgi:hypothetical protein